MSLTSYPGSERTVQFGSKRVGSGRVEPPRVESDRVGTGWDGTRWVCTGRIGRYTEQTMDNKAGWAFTVNC